MNKGKLHLPANRPTALYKYLQPDRTDVLKNLRIRFTQPILFNDIFEFFPGTDQVIDLKQAQKDAYVRIHTTLARNRHWGRKRRETFELAEKAKFQGWYENELRKSSHEADCERVQLVLSTIVHILSLTGKWDNILMWSHYSQNHEGFVIEFDGQHQYFEKGFEKVEYSDSRPLLRALLR